VERGVVDVPVVGVARSGRGLDEFRGSAASPTIDAARQLDVPGLWDALEPATRRT
jgi:hypothetical protein